MGTTTKVRDVLKAIRDSSTVNHERGVRFERLMVKYLSTDPQWTEQFSKVWMWADWPGAASNKQDTGIDLVAQDRETGGFCAIQCKFYEPQLTSKETSTHGEAAPQSGPGARRAARADERPGRCGRGAHLECPGRGRRVGLGRP